MKKIIFLLLITLLLFSCSKEADYLEGLVPGVGEEVWVYFETQCADPWYSTADAYQKNEEYKLSVLIDYLVKEEIQVLQAKYNFDPSNAIACTACNCQTGGQFLVLVPEEEVVAAKLKNIGFSKRY
jgi:hypothetical protein